MVTGNLVESYDTEKVSSKDVWTWTLEHHVPKLAVFPIIGTIMYLMLADRSGFTTG
jgi:hypothetical protein